MQGKWPDQTLDQGFGLPEVLIARSAPRVCLARGPGKTRTLMPVWDSSGEYRLNADRRLTASRVQRSFWPDHHRRGEGPTERDTS
jgi:hypothetical protein